MNKLRCLALLLALPAFGCAGGTETGNPPSGAVSLGLTAYSTAPDVAAVGAGRGGLSIDRVALNVGVLRLLPCSGGEPAVALTDGEYDLTADNVRQVMANQELCGLLFELVPATKAGADLPAGVAMYLHGLRSDGSAFDVESTASRSLGLSAPYGTSFGTESLLLGFDVGSWFTGIDVHGAHAGADGIARLDSTLNPALLTAFEAQTAAAVRLYADSNDNGLVDEAERTAIASP